MIQRVNASNSGVQQDDGDSDRGTFGLSRIKAASGRIYTRLTRAAEGGLGSVYLGTNKQTGTCIIKLAKPAMERYLYREFAVNVLAVPVGDGFAELVDWGVCRGEQPFLVFRRIDGRILRDVVPESLLEVLKIVGAVAEIVTRFHGSGFVHGDISLHNILLQESDADFCVVLIDFGLSALEGHAAKGRTIEFSAPEQILDARSDVFALARVMARLLERMPQSEQLNRDGMDACRSLLLKATHPDFQRRIRSIGEFSRELHTIENTLSGDRPDSSIRIGRFDQSSVDVEFAWQVFVRIARELPEYVCSTEDVSVPPETAKRLQQLDLQPAHLAAQLAKSWCFAERPSLADRCLVSDFAWNYSRHLNARGRFDQAAHYGAESIRILESFSNSSVAHELELSRRLNGHAGFWGRMGRPVDAVVALIRSLAIRRRVLPPDSHLLGQSLNNLANALRVEVQQAGIGMLLEAKSYWIGASGATSNDVAWADHNIGRVLSMCGQHDAASFLTKKAMSIKVKTLGDRHPQVATVAINRAEQLCRQGLVAEANDLFRRAAEINTDWFGFSGPRTLVSVTAWAKQLINAGDYEASFDLLKPRVSEDLVSSVTIESRELFESLIASCIKLRKKQELRKATFLLNSLNELSPHVPGWTVPYQAIFDRAYQGLDVHDTAAIERDVVAFVRQDERYLATGYRLEPEDLLEL